MPWLELSLRCRAAEESRLEAALEDLGALSVSLLDAADTENEQAILEPGGGICFVAKKPTPDTARHEELVARLDRISAQLAALRA